MKDIEYRAKLDVVEGMATLTLDKYTVGDETVFTREKMELPFNLLIDVIANVMEKLSELYIDYADELDKKSLNPT